MESERENDKDTESQQATPLLSVHDTESDTEGELQEGLSRRSNLLLSLPSTFPSLFSSQVKSFHVRGEGEDIESLASCLELEKPKPTLKAIGKVSVGTILALGGLRLFHTLNTHGSDFTVHSELGTCTYPVPPEGPFSISVEDCRREGGVTSIESKGNSIEVVNIFGTSNDTTLPNGDNAQVCWITFDDSPGQTHAFLPPFVTWARGTRPTRGSGPTTCISIKLTDSGPTNRDKDEESGGAGPEANGANEQEEEGEENQEQ